MTSTGPEKRRLIYGRRQGRPLKAGARAAFDADLPRLRLDLDALARPGALIPDTDDLALEVGFGGGEHLAAQAKANPRTGFIGAEPFLNGVAQALTHVEQVLPVLADHPRAGLDEPFFVYLTCYRILQANHDLRARSLRVVDARYAWRRAGNEDAAHVRRHPDP